MEADTFSHLKDMNIQTDKVVATVFGSAHAVITGVERLPHAKTGRKVSQLLQQIQTRVGIFGSQTEVQDLGIQYTTSGIGDPGFTFVAVGQNGENTFLHAKALKMTAEGMAGDISAFEDEILQGKVQIMSGTCMFGATGAKFVTASGREILMSDSSDGSEVDEPITSINVSSYLHPYEAETIVRLSEFIKHIPNGKIDTIHFHIPALEYMSYGIDLYLKGLLSGDLLYQWYQEVEKRALGVQALYAKRMPHGVAFEPISPLLPIATLMRQVVHMNPSEIMPTMLAQLANSDPVWKFILSVAQQPISFAQLSQLSFQVAYLKTAMSGQLTFVVENPSEVRIWDNLKNHLRGGRNMWLDENKRPLQLIGLYVHPRVGVAHNKGIGNKSAMFYVDTAPTLSTTREIVGAYRRRAL